GSVAFSAQQGSPPSGWGRSAIEPPGARHVFPESRPNRSHCSLSVHPLIGSWRSQPAKPGSFGVATELVRGVAIAARDGIAVASAPATAITAAAAAIRRGACRRVGTGGAYASRERWITAFQMFVGPLKPVSQLGSPCSGLEYQV